MARTRMRSLLKFVRIPTWLIILLAAALLLRIPSFFEPYSYGDEMIYLTLGHAVREGLTLYKDIHDNKPPMLYLLAALAGSLFWFKVILAFWNLITIVLFWKLVQVLFPISPNSSLVKKHTKENIQKISTVLFAVFTTIPLFEGNIANAEVFMVGFTIAGFLLLLSDSLTVSKTVLAGILFSIATLFKVPAAFDIPAIIFIWFIAGKFSKKHFKEVAVKTIYLGIGYIVPIVLTFAYYGMQGALREYIGAAFMQNVGYLSSWRPDDTTKPFFEKNAPLLFRGAFIAISFILLYLKRKTLSKSFVFVTAWLFLALFAVTLSERPYPHYLIQAVPPIAILFSILLVKKNAEQVLSILPLTIAFIVPVYFKFWYYPTYPYYNRFVKFTTGHLSKNEYLSTFGNNVVRNYKIANFINTSTIPGTKIFVWGDDAKIYALSSRLPPTKFVTDYHINDFSNRQAVMETLKTNRPEMVVVMNGSDQFPQLTRFLQDNYAPTLSVDGSEIWKLLSSDVRNLITS